MQVRIVELDGELDPDEYCKERGPDAYRERLDHAKGYFYWLADRARAKHDTRTTEGKVAVLKFLLPKVQNHQRFAGAHDHCQRRRGLHRRGSRRGARHFRQAASNRKENTIRASRSLLRHDERMLLKSRC